MIDFKNNKPYIIAELSGNHNNSLDRALELVDAAAFAGASAVKLQTFTADSMTLNKNVDEFVINNKDSVWFGLSLYDLYQEAAMPWEWHEPIMKRAQEKGIDCFSTPFDEKAVDFLEDLGAPAYKIASYECVDIPLIKKAAKTKKPLIISTGMASINEIAEAVDAARNSGCKDLTLLKCTSSYPANPKYSNLVTIPHMKQMFKCAVGLSDHTLGTGASVAAVALGATVLEKHLTLSQEDGGVDSKFSIEPNEFSELVRSANDAYLALGEIHYGATQSELYSITRRRSIYISQDIKAGEFLTTDNLRKIRPGLGLAPKYYEILLGRAVSRDCKAGTAFSWDLLS